MPAAAVTPAPIAYIKVVAVKKLVVGFLHPAEKLAFWPVLKVGGISPSPVTSPFFGVV